MSDQKENAPLKFQDTDKIHDVSLICSMIEYARIKTTCHYFENSIIPPLGRLLALSIKKYKRSI